MSQRTQVMRSVSLWRMQNERGVLSRQQLARLSTQMVSLVLWTASAEQTRCLGIFFTCVPALVIARKLGSTMAVLSRRSATSRSICFRTYVTHFGVGWTLGQFPRTFKTACQVCLIARTAFANLGPKVSTLLARNLNHTYDAKISWFLGSLRHLWRGLWDHHYLNGSWCRPSKGGSRARTGGSSSFGCSAVLDIRRVSVSRCCSIGCRLRLLLLNLVVLNLHSAEMRG